MPTRNRAQTFKDLRVWQEARALSVLTYRSTPSLPREERFGMGRQMREAALSVSSNIAEGNGRLYWGEYLHHLSHSLGSLNELESIVDIANELGYLSNQASDVFAERIDSVGYLLQALRRSVQR